MSDDATAAKETTASTGRYKRFRMRSRPAASTVDSGSAAMTDELGSVDNPAVVPGRESSDVEDGSVASGSPTRRNRWTRISVLVIAPAIALLLTAAAGFLKYDSSTISAADAAAAESVASAQEIAVQMLSYAPGTAEKTLTKAAERMSGTFRESFLSLVKDVVVPGALQKDVSATATVPAAAVTSAAPNRATLVLFIDQAITVGGSPPTNTASVAEVTLEKRHGHWLLTGFEPK